MSERINASVCVHVQKEKKDEGVMMAEKQQAAGAV